MSTVCSDASRAAGEPLGGSGIEATRWLLVESRVAWGRDILDGAAFSSEVTAWLRDRPEKVLAIRRPGRRDSPLTVFAAETSESETRLVRTELERPGDLVDRDVWSGEPVAGPLLLVCTHGRRDACCSRLGLPVFTALAELHPPELLWQCSHTGGHRFAPNVVVLPLGIMLGRVEPSGAARLTGLLSEGRVPLEWYRGRSAYEQPVQAAEVAVRAANGLDELSALRLVARDGDTVQFSTAGREVTAIVRERTTMTPKSCGAEPELVSFWHAEAR